MTSRFEASSGLAFTLYLSSVSESYDYAAISGLHARIHSMLWPIYRLVE